MTRRVVIQGSGTPLKVGMEGVDAGNADAFDLLFNGDIQPLRIWNTGYINVPSLQNYNWSPAWAVSSGRVFPTPAGTYPMFMVAGRMAPSEPITTAWHEGARGFGAFVSSDFVMWGINFTRDIGGVRGGDAIVNYCVMKNYG